MERIASQLREKDKNPIVIPAGASNALGASGYAVCANEILNQAYEQQIGIDAVFAPSGSCGTQAGLAVGFQSANANFPVYGVNVSRSNEAQVPKVQALADDLADFLEVPCIPHDLCLNLDEYVGPGYSVLTEGMSEAVRMTAETEAILLDPVYSGKAMAGLIDCVRKGMFRAGSSIVFVHTGGSPALYAYKDIFL